MFIDNNKEIILIIIKKNRKAIFQLGINFMIFYFIISLVFLSIGDFEKQQIIDKSNSNMDHIILSHPMDEYEFSQNDNQWLNNYKSDLNIDNNVLSSIHYLETVVTNSSKKVYILIGLYADFPSTFIGNNSNQGAIFSINLGAISENIIINKTKIENVIIENVFNLTNVDIIVGYNNLNLENNEIKIFSKLIRLISFFNFSHDLISLNFVNPLKRINSMINTIKLNFDLHFKKPSNLNNNIQFFYNENQEALYKVITNSIYYFLPILILIWINIFNLIRHVKYGIADTTHYLEIRGYVNENNSNYILTIFFLFKFIIVTINQLLFLILIPILFGQKYTVSDNLSTLSLFSPFFLVSYIHIRYNDVNKVNDKHKMRLNFLLINFLLIFTMFIYFYFQNINLNTSYIELIITVIAITEIILYSNNIVNYIFSLILSWTNKYSKINLTKNIFLASNISKSRNINHNYRSLILTITVILLASITITNNNYITSKIDDYNIWGDQSFESSHDSEELQKWIHQFSGESTLSLLYHTTATIYGTSNSVSTALIDSEFLNIMTYSEYTGNFDKLNESNNTTLTVGISQQFATEYELNLGDTIVIDFSNNRINVEVVLIYSYLEKFYTFESKIINIITNLNIINMHFEDILYSDEGLIGVKYSTFENSEYIIESYYEYFEDYPFEHKAPNRSAFFNKLSKFSVNIFLIVFYVYSLIQLIYSIQNINASIIRSKNKLFKRGFQESEFNFYFNVLWILLSLLLVLVSLGITIIIMYMSFLNSFPKGEIIEIIKLPKTISILVSTLFSIFFMIGVSLHK